MREIGTWDVDYRRGARTRFRRPNARQIRVPSLDDAFGGEGLLIGFDRIDDNLLRGTADYGATSNKALGVREEGGIERRLATRCNEFDTTEKRRRQA